MSVKSSLFVSDGLKELRNVVNGKEDPKSSCKASTMVWKELNVFLEGSSGKSDVQTCSE